MTLQASGTISLANVSGVLTTVTINEIDGIEFSTETAINPTATLTVTRGWCGGVQSGSL